MDQPFAAGDWTPLPRPADLASDCIRVVRAEASPESAGPESAGPGSAGSGSADPGPASPLSADGVDPAPEVVARDGARVHVRVLHRAPAARAVALQASGWWRPDPVDACDLQPVGEDWWSGTFVVPADWCATIGFVEHEGAGDPPWWTDGLKGLPAAGERRVVDLARPDVPRAQTGQSRPSDTDSPDLLDTPATDRAPRIRTLIAGDPRDAALIIVTDGEAHVERLNTPGILADLVASGALPPLRAVFIDAWPGRAEHLGVPGGQAQWIAESLVPHLRAHEGVSHDPRRTVVTGASFGGLTALFALARAPQSIGAASAQSVSLWRYPAGALAQPMADALTAGPLMPRIRLHAGRYEGSMGARARDLAEDLAQRTGHRVPVRMHSGGHDWAWWQPALIEDLIEFLGDPPEG